MKSSEVTYLDYGSSAPVMPDVADAMAEVMAVPSNPSAPHALGRMAASVVEDARSCLLEALGLDGSRWRVVFTASCTEANNAIIKSYDSCVVSAVEHKSVLMSVPSSASILSVNSHGLVDLNELSECARNFEPRTLISISGCSSETGIIQPMQDIVRAVREYSNVPVVVHSDLAQMFTKVDICVKDLGIDAFSIAGHKIGAPQGVAALVFNDRVKIKPMLTGGGQEYGARSGTQNVAAIAGLGFLLRHKMGFMAERMLEVGKLRAYMEDFMIAHNANVEIVGRAGSRVPNISCIITPGVDRKKQMIMCDMNGICISFGSSCAAGGDEPSPALVAMGYGSELRECAIRVSMGWGTTRRDIDRFLECWLGFSRARKTA